MTARQSHTASARDDLLRLVTVGGVNNGKSTLIGRLLLEAKAVQDTCRSLCEPRLATEGISSEGDSTMPLSWLTDGLQAERAQGITIDVAYRYFRTGRRKFIVADAPGHFEYTRNMVTGASTAQLALLVIDARRPTVTQTRRHAYIASLLGIRYLVIAVNKMDQVEYSSVRFEEIRDELSRYLAPLEFVETMFIPVSALLSDNIVEDRGTTPWYGGPPLLDYLQSVPATECNRSIGFRYPVQLVVNPPDSNDRHVMGTVACGSIQVGDRVVILPQGVTTRIDGIWGPDGEIPYAAEGQAVSLVPEDPIDVHRGDLIASPYDLPLVDTQFEATVVWMDMTALQLGREYLFKHANAMSSGAIVRILNRVDIDTLDRLSGSILEGNDIGRCHVSLQHPMAFDAYRLNRTTGSFIVIDPVTHRTVGAGMIETD